MSADVARWERFFLEITNRCNFDCLFCPSGISTRPRRDMDAAMATGIIDELASAGFYGALYFHVLGEPLLHPDALSLVDHAAQMGLRPVLFTNGGALTPETVQAILASRVSELVISMQTINRPSYERLRRTPISWGLYRERIAQALAAAQRAPSGPPFRVSMGVKKLDPDHPEALYFTEYESRDRIKRSLARILARVPEANLEDVYAALDERDLASLPSFHLTERVALSVKPMGNWRSVWLDVPAREGRCPFFGREMAALSDGSLTFCHIDYDGRTALANLQQTSLTEAVAAPAFGSLVEEFMAGRRVPEGCAYCKGVKGPHPEPPAPLRPTS